MSFLVYSSFGQAGVRCPAAASRGRQRHGGTQSGNTHSSRIQRSYLRHHSRGTQLAKLPRSGRLPCPNGSPARIQAKLKSAYGGGLAGGEGGAGCVTLVGGGQRVASRCRCSEVWLQDRRSEQQVERPSLFIRVEMMLQPQPHIGSLMGGRALPEEIEEEEEEGGRPPQHEKGQKCGS
ncbi:hypothetical protein AAFF_G00349130 [Aldrovandia affinis]|uniref:Uncharacterized protein n=1 Tax=Aldrovandia affinis TaxID=143900 RepID=A0AAD7WNM6_9TELE|nr:hypothetical protein AAFF_G00349130 [Aldrovandia affinis]